jgi:hypothetical protein
VNNSVAVENVGPYGFAYTAITDIDLSGAKVIDDMAFLKEEKTPFTVKLGENLETLGDNPFALCVLEPFAQTSIHNFNGAERTDYNYNYSISDMVSVIDGSLYCQVENGLELITYTGMDPVNVKLAEDTVRITAYAFAGSDVQMVTMPYSTTSIGHKAFFDCQDLHTVVFGSYDAPILEEEFDPAYYESYTHIPGSGNYGSYTDYDGTEISIDGINLMPYYMWNATGGMYSNCFYGASFVDYIGKDTGHLVMVHPVNGKGYDTFVMDQYFSRRVHGPVAAEDLTLEAIDAINRIPSRVELKDEATVLAARAAYDKVLSKAQQALVTNFNTLLSAEQRILALKTAAEETPNEEPQPEPEKKPAMDLIWALLTCGTTLAAAVFAVLFFQQRKALKLGDQIQDAADAEESEEAEETEETEETEQAQQPTENP